MNRCSEKRVSKLSSLSVWGSFGVDNQIMTQVWWACARTKWHARPHADDFLTYRVLLLHLARQGVCPIADSKRDTLSIAYWRWNGFSLPSLLQKVFVCGHLDTNKNIRRFRTCKNFPSRMGDLCRGKISTYFVCQLDMFEPDPCHPTALGFKIV